MSGIGPNILFRDQMTVSKYIIGISKARTSRATVSVTPSEVIIQSPRYMDRIPRTTLTVSYKKQPINVPLLIIGIIFLPFVFGLCLILIALLEKKEYIILTTGTVTYKIRGPQYKVKKLMNALEFTPTRTAPTQMTIPPQGERTVVIKEKVLVRCPYCGALNEQGLTKCKVCGAPL